MMPNVAPQGQSFKGAFAYYLHDKGHDQDGNRLQTAERVAWTETRNLATDGPHTACRIMIATASQADELKAAAGIKATGRKSKHGPVYSYSLSWREDEAEGITRADMVKAADDTIRLLKADHLQAVIVAHQDTKNPHVHVILNRVDPATGKLFTATKEQVRLQEWAGQYERERGVIVTPKREAKARAREANPDPDARRDYIEKRDAARKQEPAAVLKARGDAQKLQHAEERAKLSASQKARLNRIYEASGRAIGTRLQKAREEHRPLWSELYRTQKAETRVYEAREKRLAGVVANAIEAVRSRQIRGDGSDRGFLTMAFAYLASSVVRRAAFDARQTAEREQLAHATKHRTDAEIKQIRALREKTLAQARDISSKERGDLKQKHDAARADIRDAWKKIYQEREQAGKARESGTRQPRPYRARQRLDTKDARRETRGTWSEETARRTGNARRYAEARAKEKPEPQERPTMPAMKDGFDRVRGEQRPTPAPVPNRTVSLSAPTPAPSPIGDVPAITRKPADVPAIDKAKAWAKDHAQKPEAAPTVRRDWNQSASPAQAPTKAHLPAERTRTAEPVSPRKDWGKLATPAPAQKPAEQAQERAQTATPSPSPRKDWDALTRPRETPREVQPLPERSRDRDRDR